MSLFFIGAFSVLVDGVVSEYWPCALPADLPLRHATFHDIRVLEAGVGVTLTLIAAGLSIVACASVAGKSPLALLLPMTFASREEP